MPLLSATAIPGSARVADAWHDLHPAPPLPLTEEFRAGLSALLRGLEDRAGRLVPDGAVDRVTGVVKDRYSVTVSPDGLVARGLLRRRRIRWSQVESVEVAPIEAMATERLVGRLVGRSVTTPVLGWLWGRLVDPIAEALADQSTRLVGDTPQVLTAVRARRGSDIELDGPLALTALLSHGLTTAVVGEARRRGIPVRPG